MFETAAADLLVGAIDDSAGSPRRWALMLGAALVLVLAALWFTKRAATDEVVHVPDASGPG